MATFNITHRGEQYEVDAPDEASAQQKLNNHLEKQQKEDSPLTKIMRGINEKLGVRSDAAINPPGIHSAFVKGAPIIGQMVPQTPNLTDLEQNHPIINKMANVAGGMTAMAGPAAKVGQMVGSSILPQMAGQSALGVGVNNADKLIEKGTDFSSKDALNSSILGILQGVSGPVTGKYLSRSPTAEQLASKKLTDEELYRLMLPGALKEETKNVGKETVNAILSHPLTQAVTTGAATHLLTGNPIAAGIAALAPSVIKGTGHAASHLTSNEFFHNPINQALLNALMQQQGTSINR